MIAALYVATGGIYFDRPDVDPWDETMDARRYYGPYPVVAHPPCERWGRYWSGGPSARVRRTLGDDGGCFGCALASVRQFGGVLEHPEASHAFRVYGLGRPRPRSWQKIWRNEYITQVAQSAYGHRARKRTWLFYCGDSAPQDLDWTEPKGERLDEGFHSAEERKEARAAGKKPVARLSRAENLATPPAFAELLISLARGSKCPS